MKIICIGRNYADHAKELGNSVPKKPMIFMKPSTALLINNKPLYYPEFTKDLHYEVEVVLKICRNGKHVEEKFANKYFTEITLGLDFTARDIQKQCKEKGHPWEIAKAFDHSAGLGAIQPLEDFDRDTIEFGLMKNGEVVQHGNTKDLIFSFDHLISYTSRFFKLHVGDYIYTGTPAGVGAVKIGDKLEGFFVDKNGERKVVLECEVK